MLKFSDPNFSRFVTFYGCIHGKQITFREISYPENINKTASPQKTLTKQLPKSAVVIILLR